MPFLKRTRALARARSNRKRRRKKIASMHFEAFARHSRRCAVPCAVLYAPRSLSRAPRASAQERTQTHCGRGADALKGEMIKGRTRQIRAFAWAALQFGSHTTRACD